jgi:hypothetical protein
MKFQSTKLNGATFDLNSDIRLIVQLKLLSAETLKEGLQGSRILIIEDGTDIIKVFHLPTDAQENCLKRIQN